MENTKLNILPVPTFSSIGVNYVLRDVSEYETESITVREGGSNEAVRFFEDGQVPFHRTDVTVSAGGRLKLVQVFTAKQPTASALNVTLGDRAAFELVQLYIGGSDTVSEIKTALSGTGAEFRAEIGCALSGRDNLDINLIADHTGLRTTSEIHIGAVLRGQASKTFKGTIDFKKGASGAKGNEREDALLLDSRVRNRTVPVILCEEEDVEGNHGATVGRLDGGQVFYLASRGLPEERIYELAARAKLSRAIGRVSDREAVRRIYSALGWGDEDD